MSGAPEGVVIATAALEYFEDQYAAAPQPWAEVRVQGARRNLAAAVAHANLAQVRAGRVNKEDIAELAKAAGATTETVYDVLWAAADQGYVLTKTTGATA